MLTSLLASASGWVAHSWMGGSGNSGKSTAQRQELRLGCLERQLLEMCGTQAVWERWLRASHLVAHSSDSGFFHHSSHACLSGSESFKENTRSAAIAANNTQPNAATADSPLFGSICKTPALCGRLGGTPDADRCLVALATHSVFGYVWLLCESTASVASPHGVRPLPAAVLRYIEAWYERSLSLLLSLPDVRSSVAIVEAVQQRMRETWDGHLENQDSYGEGEKGSYQSTLVLMHNISFASCTRLLSAVSGLTLHQRLGLQLTAPAISQSGVSLSPYHLSLSQLLQLLSPETVQRALDCTDGAGTPSSGCGWLWGALQQSSAFLTKERQASELRSMLPLLDSMRCVPTPL